MSSPPTPPGSGPRQYPQPTFQAPPAACQIILVRHGQSSAFVEGVPFDMVAGQGDPPLSALGQYQATQLARRLRDEPIAAIYATNLRRTTQTMLPLADQLGLEIGIEPDLREVHLGEGEGGRFRQMVAEGHPRARAMRERREWSEIPGAESNAALTARTVAAIERISRAHPDQLTVVCCHGGVIGALLGHAARVDAFTFTGARNGSISHLVVLDGPWVIRSFNDAAHIGRLTADAEPPT